MKAGDRRRQAVNRAKWDESVPLHVASASYDVPSFLKGRNTLEKVEIHEVGSVRGKSLLHLQCHFGMDTLSWARLGANVTGVDFSPAAIRQARKLGRITGVAGRFVESNLYDVPSHGLGRFDVVYTAKGAICWLPDLDGWARVIREHLAPGGLFYLLEDHAISDLYENDGPVGDLQQVNSYFRWTPPGTVRWDLCDEAQDAPSRELLVDPPPLGGVDRAPRGRAGSAGRA